MAQSAGQLTQSPYYSPAFNAAVFDGPLRVYFAQHQEALALKVYFRLQQYLNDAYAVFRKSFKDHGQTVFLMLYPNDEAFTEAFSEAPGDLGHARLGEDYVIGVRGPLADEDYAQVFARVEVILEDLGVSTALLAPSV